MRTPTILVLALVAAGCRSVSQPPVKAKAPDIRSIHPAPGTALIRFEEIDEGIYKGSEPKNDADFEFLRSKNVKYILNLRFFPFLSASEQRKAKAHGMVLLTATINASPVSPSERHVNAILCLLSDKRLRPIYFHCDLGRDRAVLIAALYKVYFRGVPKEQAWLEEAQHYGFKDDWTLRGLKTYFERHSQDPTSRYIPDCSSRQKNSSATIGHAGGRAAARPALAGRPWKPISSLGGFSVIRVFAVLIALLVLSSASIAQIPRVNYTFMVVEENQDFSCVIGNPAMPFLNDLAAKYGLAASYYANAHPSISNYFMLTAGQAIYKGRMGDFRTDPVDVDNVIRELKRDGKTWRAYIEGVPGPGYTGGNIDNTAYVKRHNPLAYFEKDIPATDRANLTPFTQFSDDLASQRLANYSFFVPNLFDDAHSVKGTNGENQGGARCGDASALKQADDWLKNIFIPLLASALFRDKGLLVITFDESSNDDQSDGAGHYGGGRVPTVLIGSKVKPGYRSVTLYHHESALRLMLEALGLDQSHWPGAARDAPSMVEFFSK